MTTELPISNYRTANSKLQNCQFTIPFMRFFSFVRLLELIIYFLIYVINTHHWGATLGIIVLIYIILINGRL